MTERLYYTEPYRMHFTAQVVEELTWQGHPAVVLDRTAFYPASGGQPSDRGTLGNRTVLDVVERSTDGSGGSEIVHVLSQAVETHRVAGEIAWQRRFDHMQQHTGQHILSAAFKQLLEAATVGFHLGAESSTIDIAMANLEMEDILPIEAVANDVVWDDRSVAIRFVESDAVADLPMADPPPEIEGPIRLVEIPGPAGQGNSPLDVNPCGGTHVSRTGEIGMIKLVGREHRGDKTRIEFLCGKRALRDYEAKRRMVSTLANMLTVGTWELDLAIERLRDENKELRHIQRGLRHRLLDMESIQLVTRAVARGRYRVVGAVWQQRSPEELRSLARKLTEHSNVVALLFSVSERVHFCFARADNLDLDISQLLQHACARLTGKGGGRSRVAQGSAPEASVDEVESVLRDLESALEQRA